MNVGLLPDCSLACAWHVSTILTCSSGQLANCPSTQSKMLGAPIMVQRSFDVKIRILGNPRQPERALPLPKIGPDNSTIQLQESPAIIGNHSADTSTCDMAANRESAFFLFSLFARPPKTRQLPFVDSSPHENECEEFQGTIYFLGTNARIGMAAWLAERSSFVLRTLYRPLPLSPTPTPAPFYRSPTTAFLKRVD